MSKNKIGIKKCSFKMVTVIKKHQTMGGKNVSNN